MNKIILKCISWASLTVLILTAILYLVGKMEIDTVKKWMMILTIVWFTTAGMWMWDKKNG